MDDFTSQIEADGGKWAESEILGDQAITKVSASEATLATIQTAEGFRRIPKVVALETKLTALTQVEANGLETAALNAGYRIDEVSAKMGPNIRQKTLGDYLRLLTTRRLKPRYDKETDTIICDGAEQVCRTPENVDAAV
jgi:hypothetical protein